MSAISRPQRAATCSRMDFARMLFISPLSARLRFSGFSFRSRARLVWFPFSKSIIRAETLTPGGAGLSRSTSRNGLDDGSVITVCCRLAVMHGSPWIDWGDMGLIDDIMKALDRVPVWKKLQDMPGQVAQMEQRIAKLEAKLSQPLSENSCPACGERTFFVVDSGPARGPGHRGGVERHYKCKSCGFQEYQTWGPGSQKGQMMISQPPPPEPAADGELDPALESAGRQGLQGGLAAQKNLDRPGGLPAGGPGPRGPRLRHRGRFSEMIALSAVPGPICRVRFSVFPVCGMSITLTGDDLKALALAAARGRFPGFLPENRPGPF